MILNSGLINIWKTVGCQQNSLVHFHKGMLVILVNFLHYIFVKSKIRILPKYVIPFIKHPKDA